MISFVIPAKNEERYIADCIHSIYAQQPVEPMEIIVVNNNSTDRTEALVRKKFPEVKTVFELRPGTNQARQTGFEHARGEIVCFLDSDVRLPAGWCEQVVKTLRSSQRVVAVSGPYRFYDFPWYWNWLNEFFIFFITTPFLWVGEFFNLGAQMVGGNMAIKRSAFERINGFNTSLKFYGDDTLTALQLKKIGRVIFSPRYVAYSSARRYMAHGVVRTTCIYILNFFSIWLTKKPYHEDAEIVR